MKNARLMAPPYLPPQPGVPPPAAPKQKPRINGVEERARLLIGTLLSLGLYLAVLVRVMIKAVNEIQNFTMPKMTP